MDDLVFRDEVLMLRDLSTLSIIIAARRTWAPMTSSRLVSDLRMDGASKSSCEEVEDVGEWKVELLRRVMLVLSGVKALLVSAARVTGVLELRRGLEEAMAGMWREGWDASGLYGWARCPNAVTTEEGSVLYCLRR
jgi:hypothetical protein